MREKFYRFMQGRYGQDQLSRFLLILDLIFLIANIFLRSSILSAIILIVIIFIYFRMFSRNHAARYAENQRYLNATARFRYWLKKKKKLANERKYHRIYVCPKCKQKIRIPKGKGKIMVRCPKCHHEFQRRS